MGLSPSGRIRLNVTGARGAIGIDLQGTPTPGQFLVKAPGSGRSFNAVTPIAGPQNAVPLTDLAGTAGTSLVGYGGQSLTDRLKNENYVTDTRFAGGAKGDGVADDSNAIQAAIDNGGTVVYPKGTYKITKPIVLRDRVSHVGVGGHDGSLIVGTHSGPLFQASSVQFASFEKMAFTGAGCIAILQTGSPTMGYFSDMKVSKCHFYGDLSESIRANLIRAIISENTDGYFGNVNSSHRCLASIGKTSNLTNLNTFCDNVVYNGAGTECILLQDGSGWSIVRNNIEKNKTLPIRINGIVKMEIEDNFFEDNSGTQYEIEINIGQAVSNLSGLKIDENQFVRNASVTRYVQINTTNFDQDGWTFDNNKNLNTLITNDYSHLANQIGTAQLVDVSGAGLVLQDGLATFKREKTNVTLSFSVAYPTNTSTSAAIIGGLPFTSKKIQPGIASSNVDGGLGILTNANNTSASFYKGSSLITATNSDLSGKTVYVTLSYFV